jgi:hypothetical protein
VSWIKCEIRLVRWNYNDTDRRSSCCEESMEVINFVLLVNLVNISYPSLLTHLNPLNLLRNICWALNKNLGGF